MSVVALVAIGIFARDNALGYAVGAAILAAWLLLAPSREELRHARLAVRARALRLAARLGIGRQA
jgi:hypothetical protein